MKTCYNCISLFLHPLPQPPRLLNEPGQLLNPGHDAALFFQGGKGDFVVENIRRAYRSVVG